MNNFLFSCKKTIFVFSLILFFLINSSGIVKGIANPAAVYCKDLGYDYKIVNTDNGQKGTCVFPDGTTCDAWNFYAGICGSKYSACAKYGYETKTITNGRNSFSPEYSSCIMTNGKEIPASNLINLEEKLSRYKLAEESTIPRGMAPTQSQTSTTTVPSSFDWRDKDGKSWTTPVKDQGICGACWVFSAIGVIESKIKIVNNNPNLNQNLSEQDVLSCSGYGDCENGGTDFLALKYVKDKGVVEESCFPYYQYGISCSNKCSIPLNIWTIDGWTLDSLDNAKSDLINLGPFTAVMNISAKYWDYSTGKAIMRCENLDYHNWDHSVAVVGYVDTPGEGTGGYWIVRNSWGLGWPMNEIGYTGEDTQGYFRLAYGQCNLMPEYHVNTPNFCMNLGVSDGSYPDTHIPLCINQKSGYPSANQIRDYYSCQDGSKICNIIYDSKLDYISVNGVDNGDITISRNDKISVVVNVANTGTLAQGWWMIGVEFWKVLDYYNPSQRNRGVLTYYNGYTKQGGNYQNIPDATCNLINDPNNNGILDPDETVQVKCYVPVNYYGLTSGNQRIMIWVHERDYGQDAGNDNCGGYNCNDAQEGCPVGQCKGGNWWSDALAKSYRPDVDDPIVGGPTPVTINVINCGHIQGDVNCDDIVDANDATLLSSAFNSNSDKPNWDSRIDLNGDNVVDIYDAIILANNFGRHM